MRKKKLIRLKMILRKKKTKKWMIKNKRRNLMKNLLIKWLIVLSKHKKFFEKSTFASKELIDYIISNNYTNIEFIGLVTDICVVSNVLLCKGLLPNAVISVDADCCAGTSYRNHVSALEVMKSCQINIHHS